MKVVMVSPYPPDHDGIGTYAKLIGDELRRQGLDVGVLTTRDVSPREPAVIATLGHSPRSVRPAWASVRGAHPDLVHIQFAFSIYGARVALLLDLLRRLRRAGIPVVVTMHEITRDVDSLGRVGEWLYRAVARSCSRIIVHTESARGALRRHVPQAPPVAVVPHPQADAPSSAVTAEELRRRHGLVDRRVLLSFGFIHVDKGLEDLVGALGRLTRSGGPDGPELDLVIAGEVRRRQGVLRPFELRDQLYLRRLRRAVRREGLGRRVHFVGFVPDDEVRAWFDLAELAVLPYRRIEQSGAGSLARGAGTPLLTTSVGELARLGTFPPVPARDPESLAGGLRDALRVLAATDRSTRGPAMTEQTVTVGLADAARSTTEIYADLVGGAAR